ncbi:MAG: Clp protease ClpP [Minwuia sp.]|nr:Clp protease ClpP [Minwuia sp.]
MNANLITLPALCMAHTDIGICARLAPIDLPDAIPGHARRGVFARGTGRQFDVRAEGSDCTTLVIYDEIGEWGISARMLRQALASITTPRIRLEINSPGGDVFDGIAMFNDLVSHAARIEVVVTGVAASAASVIAMAGDSIAMHANAFMMIHNAWSITIGDRQDHAAMVAVLGGIDAAIARTYARRADDDTDVIAAMMDAETWMDAEQAVDRGFADSIIADETDPAARAAFDLSIFNKTPRELMHSAPLEGDPTIRDAERALRDAGFSRTRARAMASGRTPQPDNGNQREADEPDFGPLLASIKDLASKMKPQIGKQ